MNSVLLSERGAMMSIWLGVVQSDPLAVGTHRHYKWKRSDVDIPSTTAMWANRYLPSADHPESCGYFIPTWGDSRLHDDQCSFRIDFICEW